MSTKQKEKSRRATTFGTTLANVLLRSESVSETGQKQLPFSFLKSFVTKMNQHPTLQKQLAADVTRAYKTHDDYIVTQKDVSILIPNMNIRPDNKALSVFGISFVESKENEKYYRVSPLLFIYAILLNTCNEVNFDEKIRFAFNMYDNDQDGLLCKDDMKKLLAYQNEENSIGLEEEVINEMVETIFDELDVDQGGTIDLDEFTAFFKRFEHTNITLSAGNKRTAAISDEKGYTEHIKMNFRSVIKRQLSIEGSKYFWIFAYLVGLAITAWSYWTTYYNGIIARGFAKMFAGMVCYNLALIVLIINKSFITFLRVIPFLPRVFPVNKNIVFHKIMAVVMLICAFGHSGAHLIGTFRLISSTPIEELNTILHSPLKETPSYPRLLFASVPGLTGIFIVIGFVTIIVLARKPVRTKNYELFWYSHHIYIAMFILLQIHGMKELIAAQTYWKWMWGPLLFLLSEKGLKFYKAILNQYQIVKLKVSSGVVELELKRPRTFMYTAGQYATICVPHISKTQWHAFTISSCPNDSTITFHISPVGWWTKKLAQLAKEYDTKKISRLPTLKLDGPWGAPSQHYEDFKHLMIISSGIGATPFCSILREILGRLKRGDKRLKFKKIDFFWVNRKPQNTGWLNKVLMDLRTASQDLDGEQFLNLYIFYTGAYEKYDFRSFMLWNGFQFMKEKGKLTSDKIANYDCMHWGRPDWEGTFSQTAKNYQGKKVGVFMCANKILCKEIYDLCVKYSGIADFHFYKENFS